MTDKERDLIVQWVISRKTDLDYQVLESQRCHDMRVFGSAYQYCVHILEREFFDKYTQQLFSLLNI